MHILLIDTSSTNSFISSNFVLKLDKKPVMSSYSLTVYTPSGGILQSDLELK